jgi:SAM-dependent methyltransferase
MPFSQEGLVKSYQSVFHKFFYEDIAHYLLRMVFKRKTKFEMIMDLGCGSGYATQVLKKKFAEAQIIGVDSSPAMLNQASDNHCGVKFEQMAAEELDFKPQSFDLVFGNMCYHWFEAGALESILTVLKPGGILALSFPLQERKVLGNANTLLVQAYKHLRKRKLSFPNPGHKMGFSLKEIDKEFKDLNELQVSKIFKSEKFPSFEDLIFSLKARGILHALFDNQVAAAEQFMQETAPQSTWELTWEIALVTGSKP